MKEATQAHNLKHALIELTAGLRDEHAEDRYRDGMIVEIVAVTHELEDDGKSVRPLDHEIDIIAHELLRALGRLFSDLNLAEDLRHVLLRHVEQSCDLLLH